MAMTRDFAKGFLLGAGVSAAAALLLAPRSGAETRRALAEKKNQLKDRTSARVAEYRDRGQQAADKARRTLGSTKEGLRDAGRTLVQPVHDERSA